MEFCLEDTIAAPAAAAGAAWRGIIRISGAATRSILEQRFVPDDPSHWMTARLPFVHPGQWRLAVLGRSLSISISWWPAQRSYTGEPLAELHLSGSPPLLEALLADLYACGARPARGGEFTLRAFLSGRVDLVQAEAVLDVIDAHTRHDLEQALEQLAGGVSSQLRRLRHDLLDLLAELEAGLDFTEEGLEFLTRDALSHRLQSARQILVTLREQSDQRMRSAIRPRVVLTGRPNAGKSTLFNALTGGELALVSPESGTTRDWLTAELDWNGLSVELIDTAGTDLAEMSEPASLQQQMQAGRANQVSQADLILLCITADESEDESSIPLATEGIPVLRIRTKADLIATETVATGLCVSALTGRGLDELRTAVTRQLSSRGELEGGLLGTTAARCQGALDAAIDALDRAVQLATESAGEEFLAADVRETLDALGTITGEIYTDDILDRIFSKFCIGK